MKAKIFKIITKISVIAFWLGIWEIIAILYNNTNIIPTVELSFITLCNSIRDTAFISTVAASLFRVLLGFVLGTLLSTALAILASKVSFVKALVSPVMTVAKSTPVVAIILIVWLLVGGKNVPVAISTLMVMPIIWQNLIDGFNSIDTNLSEICTVYNFSYGKKFRLLIFPTLMRFLLPGLLTASGLAFKSGIAAEYISMVKYSIGKEIYDAKTYNERPHMFAWVIVIILLSFVIEFSIKNAVRRIEKKWHL